MQLILNFISCKSINGINACVNLADILKEN